MNCRRFFYCLLMIMPILSGCLTGGERYISKREPMPVMATQKVQVPDEPHRDESKPKELFVRQKDIKIRRKTPVNDTGSLTDLNDPRAYLFGFERPLEVGSYLDVKITSNRVEAKSAPKDQVDTASDPAAAKPADTTTANDESKNILKSLPNLEPLDGKAAVMTSMKMQIMERFDNGDVLVMHRRRSIRDGQASEVVVTSRVPSTALSRQDQVTTNDLVEVDWRESFDGDVVERKSANWEDEYTLRLSGFEESKSKQAMALDEKHDQLKKAREKLEKEMKQHVSDRDKMSKERATMMEEKEKNTQKISELTTENEELKKKLGEETAEATETKDGEKKADTKAADKKAGDKKTEEKKPDPKKADSKKPAEKK